MSQNKPYMKGIWRTGIFWELTWVNLAVIVVVIIIAGFSVKEYACFLANDMNIAGPFMQSSFDETMDFYLIRVSIIAFLVAVVIHYIWIRRIIIPIRMLSDVTKRMSDGEEMRLVPITTRNEVGLLTENFNSLIKKIKRSEELRNKMAADLAHEVRTPLSNITGYLEAIKNGVIEPDKNVLHSLHGEAERLSKLIEQLHHLSEREWNQYLDAKPSNPANIKTIVNHMVSIHQMKLDQKHIQIEVAVEEAAFHITEDTMKQIVGNLLDNAIRYGIENTTLHLKGKRRKDHYVLQVEGQGQFIPEASRPQIFERFYRVDTSRNRESGGNGLGLAIVKELAERQDGSVALETDGNYHQFIVKLPSTAML
ncbi:ATP-binding protein [Siminovitchia sp. FSL W7-1587]|uniref:sensor histidine kinase n=1 Tax=Siminovitchia sp. FSL W7-1587 TaxID=2954699 RepID=UPI0030CE510A